MDKSAKKHVDTEKEEMKTINEEALAKFRRKDYYEALEDYQKLLENNCYERDSNQERNALNNALISMVKVITQEQLTDEYRIKEMYSEFDKYLNRYLKIARDAKPQDLKEWADNILTDLFRNTILLAIYKWSTKERREVKKKGLKEQVKNRFNEFVETFCHDNIFDETLFIEKFLEIVHSERVNENRKGSIGQNQLNTKWLSEEFLSLTDNNNRKRRFCNHRVSIMNLLSEIVFYYPEEEKKGEFHRELATLEWLDKSLQEDPENAYAKERKKQIGLYMTSTAQINRFKHDTVSKIETIRGIIRSVDKLEDINAIKKKLGIAHNSIDDIESSYRLTQGESPKQRLIDMGSFAEKLKIHEKVSITIPDSEESIHSDEGYLLLILKNLIRNSLEAYNSKEGVVEVRFDYRRKTFTVSDCAGGISDELLEYDKLYEPHVSTKGIHADCGLGLAIVKEACYLLDADIHHETIRCEHDRKGTRFTIKLQEMEED